MHELAKKPGKKSEITLSKQDRPVRIDVDVSNTREATRHVEAVISALALLDCFEDHEELAVGDLSKLTGINRSRIMRLAGTLGSRGYLAFNPETRGYRLGTRLLVLGQRFVERVDVVAAAAPALTRLAEETGETASLFGVDGRERVVLALKFGHYEVRHALTVGARKELSAGASGKVLLAWSDTALLDYALSGADEATRRKLEQELAVVRQNGFAVSHSERIPDAAAISAPVFGAAGQLLASIGISGAATRFSTDFSQVAIPLVVSEAQALSRKLGWSDEANDVT